MVEHHGHAHATPEQQHAPRDPIHATPRSGPSSPSNSAAQDSTAQTVPQWTASDSLCLFFVCRAEILGWKRGEGRAMGMTERRDEPRRVSLHRFYDHAVLEGCTISRVLTQQQVFSRDFQRAPKQYTPPEAAWSEIGHCSTRPKM